MGIKYINIILDILKLLYYYTFRGGIILNNEINIILKDLEKGKINTKKKP